MVLMELMENLMVLSEGVPFLKTKKCLGEFHGKKKKKEKAKKLVLKTFTNFSHELQIPCPMNKDLDFPKTKQRSSMHKKFGQDKPSEM